MNIREYQIWVRKIWDYNEKPLRKLNQRDDLIMSLGLAGETGEVLEIIKKHFRSRGKKLDTDHLKEELGDVLYYLMMIATRYKIDVREIIECNFQKCEKRKAIRMSKKIKRRS